MPSLEPGDRDWETPLESSEDIEIIRFLEKRIPVKILNVSSGTVAVDFPEDIEIVEGILND